MFESRSALILSIWYIYIYAYMYVYIYICNVCIHLRSGWAGAFVCVCEKDEETIVKKKKMKRHVPSIRVGEGPGSAYCRTYTHA